MSVELLESRGCKPHRFAIELERDLPEEQFRERGQIVGPLPKRRNLQDDRVDSEVEIGPECLLLDESVEVLVRGGDQADVDLALAHVAEAPEFLLLQHLQELRLDGEWHVPDLVEKERPLVRDLEKAELGGDRAGESALLVPEELALQELRRKPGAIQVQEALLAARPVAVNPGREDAFAGPRLSVDEDRDVRAGDTLRPIAEEADRSARAAEGIDLPPRLARFVLKAAAAIALVLENPIDDEKKRRQLHGLGQKLLRSFLDRLNRHVELFVPGENDTGNARVGPLHVREDVERGPIRQSRGDNESVRSRCFEGLDRDAAGRRLRRLVPVDLEHFP